MRLQFIIWYNIYLSGGDLMIPLSPCRPVKCFWSCFTFFFLPFLFLVVRLARRLNVEFDWKRCNLSVVVQTFSLMSQSTFQISLYIAQLYVLGMIARQWFVIHMPLWGLIREGMFWLDYAARVLNFMLCVTNQKISLVTQAACARKQQVPLLEKTSVGKWSRPSAVEVPFFDF